MAWNTNWVDESLISSSFISEENKKRLEFRYHESRKGKLPKTKKDKKKLYGSLELPISFDDYSNPIPKKGINNILKLNHPYKLKIGDYFPFDNFIKLLFSGAKKITIIEPYLYHRNGIPKRNVEFIISLVSESTPIEIETQEKKLYPYFKDKVKCSACGWILIDKEFDDHKKICHESKFPTPIDVKPSEEIKMVRCSAWRDNDRERWRI